MASFLNIQSYNMKGFRNSCEYVRSVIDKDNPDFLCLQETWHLKEMHEQFANIHDDYTYVEESGVDSRAKIHTGRLYGGQAILLKKCLASNVSKLQCTN